MERRVHFPVLDSAAQSAPVGIQELRRGSNIMRTFLLQTQQQRTSEEGEWHMQTEHAFHGGCHTYTCASVAMRQL